MPIVGMESNFLDAPVKLQVEGWNEILVQGPSQPKPFLVLVIMEALQSKHLMEANSSVVMQLKLRQPYGHRGNQSKTVCGLNQNDLKQKLYSLFFIFFFW